MSSNLKEGERVEICPARLTKNFREHAAFDGCRGVLELLPHTSNYRTENAKANAKARVIIESTNRAGTRYVPLDALKPLTD